MRPGLYADDSITRRVNRENVLMLGGGRALLMQLAHPKVAAGVDEHSDFRKRPVYRLRRTIRLTMAIVFGDRETALAAARSVNRVHQHVRGESYSALDTDLLLWVHATMVDTAETADAHRAGLSAVGADHGDSATTHLTRGLWADLGQAAGAGLPPTHDRGPETRRGHAAHPQDLAAVRAQREPGGRLFDQRWRHLALRR